MNNLLSSFCDSLFFENKINGSEKSLLQKAARWALQDSHYELKLYEPVALRPVLATLRGHKANSFIPAIPLTMDEEKLESGKKTGLLMPVSAEPQPTNLKAHLEKLKSTISSSKDERRLLTALEYYASTLAVSERYDDLSLYDFIKTTVGIATCLQASTRADGRLRLAGGSISGIQTYLYDIVSKNAAKLLKGRSFYLQLLADSMLNNLLQRFDLSPCNVVYASGGGFFVLLPNEMDVAERFDDFTHEIATQLYGRHTTALFAELVISQAFDATCSVPDVWNELYQKLDALKYKRLQQHEQIMNDFFSDAVEVGGLKKRDPITNEEMEDKDIEEHYGVEMLKTTQNQIALGKYLCRAKLWATAATGHKKAFDDPFGSFHYLVDDRNDIPQDAVVRTFNQPDALEPFTFYGGHDFPVFEQNEKDEARQEYHYKGEVKPFDYIIKSEGFTRLAILRMDVDGLGAIFAEDIARVPEARYTINFTRYAAVSRSLDYFFKAYLNTLQKQFKDTSIIIYSGGDDLFIAGKWDDILDLAQNIHREFKNWSCGQLTLSGGIVLLPAKFPVMQGARLAEVAEKKAKGHRLPDGSAKNAICLFDKPLNWEQEFTIVRELYEEMLQLYSEETPDKLNKSFIAKINGHAMMEQAYLESVKNKAQGKTDQHLPPKWRWLMAYDMSRYTKNLKGQARAFIDRMATSSFINMHKGKQLNSEYSFLELLQIAVRLVELTIRQHENSDS